jgi:hypothetical protein
MAQVSDRNPLVFDANGQSYSGTLKICSIRAVGGTGAAVVTGTDGRLVWESASLAVGGSDSQSHLGWVEDGIIVTNVPTGGEVYVYYE